MAERIDPTSSPPPSTRRRRATISIWCREGCCRRSPSTRKYTDNHQPSAGIDWSDQATLFGQEIPIYEGGLIYSQVREAKQTASQRRLQVVDVRRQVREQVSDAWTLPKPPRRSSSKTQVEANQLALEGVRQEALVGSRTTLDVLDAEQTFVDLQVPLATAERDRIVGLRIS